jgi:6-phosphogluconolactonase
MAKPRTLVYVGTYTKRGSEGIYIFTLSSAGALACVGKATEVDNPSFLAFHPTLRYLYAVNETSTYDGAPGGSVSAFAIGHQDGHLSCLNQQPSQGSAPCHLSVDQTGRFVLVANYTSGSLSVLPIAEDGRLGEATQVTQHVGSSADPERQTGPHAHSITLDRNNRYAFAADLGLDKIMVYRFDLKEGKLIPHDEPWVQTHPGAGPRHFDIHPDRQHAYVINEIDSTLTAFAYDEAGGTLEEIQTISTLPSDFTGDNTCADVHVSPAGRFLYGSNRGHDSIAIFEIDSRSGKLTSIGHESTRGRTPRSFALDPGGEILLAANQDTDTIVTFHVDQQTGRLTPTGHVTEVPMPVCIKPIRLT